MPAPRTNYGITRLDQDDKRNHGFYVRITYRGKTHQKYFPDKSSGGKKKAFTMAQDFRDDLLKKMPEYKQEMAARKKRKALKSGVVGVTHVVSKVGDNKEYQYWQAAWADDGGNRRTAKFSIGRYGMQGALDMAVKARAKAVRDVNEAIRSSRSPQSLEIEIDIDEGEEWKLPGILAELARMADELHRGYGGKGLVIDDVEIEARVGAGVLV